MILQGKRIILGVSGGIAAYKAADLASKLTQVGAQVDVVLTRAAASFVGPLTFEALTQGPVHSDALAMLEGEGRRLISSSSRLPQPIPWPAWLWAWPTTC